MPSSAPESPTLTAVDEISVSAGAALQGTLTPPGDKSISHRSFLLATLATGTTEVRSALETGDCGHSKAIAAALGCRISYENGVTLVDSPGLRDLSEPEAELDCGRSGTTMRLLCGLLAGRPFPTFLTADPQLAKRPMGRVLEPLSEMGAQYLARAGGTRAPIAFAGSQLQGVRHELKVASAQVKSALLLAGLDAHGETVVVEPGPARDHTERMLIAQGAPLTSGITDGRRWHRIERLQEPLQPLSLTVPADPSSAAFPLVAACIVPGSDVVLRNVCINPTRDGVIRVLQRMGANITLENERMEGGEPVADLAVRSGPLTATEIQGAEVVTLIDELPIVAVAAAMASGETVVRDAAEMRVKETDRIATTAEQLAHMGAQISETPDGWRIVGGAGLRGADVHSHGDHRLAMALTVAGLVATGTTNVRDVACAADSYPGFFDDLRKIGGRISPLEAS
ncbi:MAG: 3-phosphoshikimate 1-carboxyvinyltransferase [Myxococcales bacterium]|nr:3-phosphoshikimate 1-carboxyvinyltransferase [Myxococcales bacterium]